MTIQQDKADINQITLSAFFENFENNFLVCTDELRL